MQKLANRKSMLRFVTEDTVRYRGKLRRVVVEVSRCGYTGEIRLEGTRARFPFSWAGLYQSAAARAEAKARAERKEKKKRAAER